MIEGLLGLLLCQVVGTFLADWLHLKVPGPVLGMLLLLCWLTWRKPREDAPVLRAGDAVLNAMPLLFIPAGVGVVAWLGLIKAQWLPIGVGMIVPWAAGLLATAGAAHLVLRWLTPDAALESEAERLVGDAADMDGLDWDEDL